VQDNPEDGDQLYVAAPEAFKVVDEPLQIATLEPPLTTGNGFTVIVTVAVFTQPLEFVPVTVYVVVAVGLAVGLAQFVQVRPLPGDHV
jgi:hypothetical protein